jgi:hypothetical protein
MALIRKISRTGIDTYIDQLQVDLYNGLGWDTAAAYDSYARAYKNETNEGNLIPEIHVSGNEYNEVYFNDNIDANSFFLVDDTRTGDKVYSTTISIIFQLKLDKIFPLISGRADENAHVAVLSILEDNSTIASISSLITGINNVYAGLKVDQSRFNDMQPFHVFRVDMLVNFQNC